MTGMNRALRREQRTKHTTRGHRPTCALTRSEVSRLRRDEHHYEQDNIHAWMEG